MADETNTDWTPEFEVTEFWDVADTSSELKMLSILDESSETIKVTTKVKEFRFGNIRITRGQEGDTLVIEDMGATDGTNKARFADKMLTVAGGEKAKPGDPAGSRVPPRVIVKRKPR